MGLVARLYAKVSVYPRLLWLLGIGAFLNVAGLSFLWPLNSIYIHDVLGRPLTVAGLVLLLNSGGASIGQLVGGVLYDRIGARPVLLVGLVSAACIIALPGIFSSWPLYVTVMALFGFTASLIPPSMNALAAKAWPEGGREAFNFLYVANNLGVALGTAVGGIVAQHSFKLAFLSAAFAMLIFAVFAFLFIHDRTAGQGQDGHAGSEAVATGPETVDWPIPWVPVVALFSGLVMLWLVYVQWQGAVAVHMQGMGIPITAYSVLWTLNGALIFAGQPVIALAIRKFKSLSAQMFLGTSLFVLSFLLLLSAEHYPAFVGGMVLLTFGEMFLFPTIPAAVAQLSPPSMKGFLQGVIGSATTGGRMLGPIVGGILFDRIGYHRLLVVAVCLLAIPFLSFLVYSRSSGHPSQVQKESRPA